MKYNLAQRVFLVKKGYELKEISLVQRAFRTEYPKDGTPSHSVIKNILSNFEKHGSVAHVPPKHKNSGQKREMVKNQLENFQTSGKLVFWGFSGPKLPRNLVCSRL